MVKPIPLCCCSCQNQRANLGLAQASPAMEGSPMEQEVEEKTTVTQSFDLRWDGIAEIQEFDIVIL